MSKNERIQQETIKIIKESQNLIMELIEREEKNDNTNREKTLSLTNLKEHQKLLTNELQKLNNLEYVIAFVGTMKSGKSMTINAIVGQEILPSREFPMTTLPTLITHKPNQTEPILSIQKVAPFTKLVTEIQTKLKENNNLSNLQEIQDLVNEIKNNNINFETKYVGQENISKFLKEINDLMRVAKELQIEPPYDQYTDVDDLPRIEVEFYHLKKHNQEASTAKLTLLDTPGPDEVKHSKLLKKIFQEQLKRASAVTLVVDYTKMNNESDAEVKEQVKDVANMIGKKHLFVLLNKFDQRKRKKGNEEESKKEAKKLIVEEILKNKIKDENVFPISSKHAFYSNLGLRELDYKKEININLSWVDEFGTTILGEDWEDDIEDTKRIEKKCNSYWDKSFFEEPLNNIISTVHSEASMLVLDAPLGKIKTIIDEVEKALKIKTNALTMKIQTLQENIDEVENKISSIDEISSNLEKDIDEKSKENSENINKQIQSSIDNYSNSFQKALEKKTEEEIAEEVKESKTGQIKITVSENLSWLNTTLWEGGVFGGTANKKENIVNIEELKKNGKRKFKNKTDAKIFLNDIRNTIVKELQSFPKEIQDKTNQHIVNFSNQINQDIKEEMGGLIKEISKNLGENISIDLPQLNTEHFDIETNIELNTDIKINTRKYKEKGDGIFNTILNFTNRDWGLEEKEESFHTITNKAISENIRKTLNDIGNKLKENVETTYKENIQEKVGSFLKEFIKKIEGYKEEQREVLKNRQSMKVDRDEALYIVNHFLSLTHKISKRRDVTQNILHQG